MGQDISRQQTDYRQLSRLKRGYFGTVYKVKKRGEKPIYALKKIKLSFDTAMAAQREIQYQQKLPSHPCVVSLLDHFIADSMLNLVMEFCDIGTLNSYMWVNNLTRSTLRSFMSDMTEGLNHLHMNGIVHGDIKPDNILLCSSGNMHCPKCKISDFGLARFSGDYHQVNMQYLVRDPGSLCFTAPEVVFQEKLTRESDIFSLGVVFYAIHTREGFDRGNTGMLSPTTNGLIMFWQALDEEKTQRIRSQILNGTTAKIICDMVRLNPYDRLPLSGVLSNLPEISMKGILTCCGIIFLWMMGPTVFLFFAVSYYYYYYVNT